MEFLTADSPWRFTVEGCPERSATRMAILVNFMHLHVRDTVVILDKGNPPHPRCPQCDILVPWYALNGRHLATAQWDRGVERKIRRLAEEELRDILERIFQAYGTPLNNVTEFKYMGRVMNSVDEDWTEVSGIIHKEKKSWWRMLRI